MSVITGNISKCNVCLSSTQYIKAITDDQMGWLKMFSIIKVEQLDSVYSTLHLCLYCNYLFKKVIMFLNKILMLYEMGKKHDGVENLQNSITPFLVQSKLEVHYFSPDVTENNDLKTESEDMFENHWCDDNDDIPLLVVKEREKLEQDKNKSIHKRIRLNSKNRVAANVSKPNKPQNGFSSRMVIETSEYAVVRLTKDQVLKEMNERSKTDRYLRSPYKCERCIKGFNFEDVLLAHSEKHIEKPGYIKCELCSQYCPNSVSMRGHMKSHFARYQCKVCSVVKLSRQHLLEHYSVTHTADAREYECQFCQFRTVKRTVMQRHRRSHQGPENLTCDKCGKAVKNIESLRVHRLSHDKSKLFECDQCHKKFVYQSTLNKHVLSVHVNREYYCVECDVSFKSLSNMRLHFKRGKKHRDATPHLEPEIVEGNKKISQAVKSDKTVAGNDANKDS